MYEKLTELLPVIEAGMSGRSIYEFHDAVYSFVDEHPEMELRNYERILKDHGLEWSERSMANADVSVFDGRSVMALLVALERADRYSHGIVDEFLRNGVISQWIIRLKQIDDMNELSENGDHI